MHSDRYEALTIRGDGYVGIGQSEPANALDIRGALSVGSDISGKVPAPRQGAIIEGNLGLGSTVVSNKLDVSGAAAFGASYAGKSIAPNNGIAVQGSVGVGTSSPRAPVHVVALDGSPSNTAEILRLQVGHWQNRGTKLARASMGS